MSIAREPDKQSPLRLLSYSASSTVRAGITITGTDGITATGTDGIQYVGTSGITATGTDNFLFFTPNGITATGTDAFRPPAPMDYGDRHDG